MYLRASNAYILSKKSHFANLPEPPPPRLLFLFFEKVSHPPPPLIKNFGLCALKATLVPSSKFPPSRLRLLFFEKVFPSPPATPPPKTVFAYIRNFGWHVVGNRPRRSSGPNRSFFFFLESVKIGEPKKFFGALFWGEVLYAMIFLGGCPRSYSLSMKINYQTL